MTGRKRLKAGEKLNVYVRVIDRGKLYTRLRHIKDQLNFIYDAEKEIKLGKGDKLIFRAWNDEGGERFYAHLLNYGGAGKVSRKETAYCFLRWQEGTLERLLRDSDTLGDDSALPRMVHEWLDQEGGYDVTHWLDYDEKFMAKTLILAFLEDYVGKNLNKEEWGEFTSKFIDISAVIVTFPHDNARKSDLKCRAINDRLKFLKLPYFAQKDKNTYKIVREMEDIYES